MAISFDYGLMLEEAIGASGLPSSYVQDAAVRMHAEYAAVQEDKKAGRLGFAKLPHDSEGARAAKELAAAMREEYEALLVIGIGGSDLGARAVHRALNHQFYNQLPGDKRKGPRVFFFGDTTDPVAVREVLDMVDLARTAVVIISKSGNTIEQMSTFLLVREELERAVGREAVARHVVAITGAAGTLRELAVREGYRTLPVPEDVGGRFSVLSTVGLFVLAVVGIDVDGLLAGAAAMDEHDSASHPGDNMAALFALTQYLAYAERGQNISVLMPYAYGLREVGFWYRQLWAESLGKKHDVHGAVVEVGPTPVAAVGPTDQHSQMQLYIEGPRDKVITFVRVERSATDMRLASPFEGIEGVHYLDGHGFAEIVKAEQEASAIALAKEGRPSCLFSLERLDAYHLGSLLYCFELAVTYAGRLLAVDAFDQPGVELGKQNMYGLLGRHGFAPPQAPETPAGARVSL